MEMRLRLHMFWVLQCSQRNRRGEESVRGGGERERENKLWCLLVMMTGCSQGDRMNMGVT